jgi:pilus assembly protein Flp/PilA
MAQDKMLRVWVWLKTLRNERGQGVIEYAVLLALILLVAIVMIKAVGPKVNNTFNKINANLSGGGGGGGGGGEGGGGGG